MTTLTLRAEGKKLKALVSVLSVLDIPFDKIEHPYNQDFVKKIQESEQEKKEGKTRKISLDDIWK